MSKFCTSCGASLDDNATFCTSCGAKLAVSSAQAASTAASDEAATPLDALKDKSIEAFNNFKNNPKRNTYIGIAAIAVVAIVLIILLVNLISGGYKGALKDYFGAIEDKDGKAYAKSQMSDDMIDYMMDEEDIDKDDFYDGYKAGTKSTYNALKEEFGSGIKISFDVTDKEKIEKDKLEVYEAFLLETIEDIKVSKGYEVELEIEVEGKDDDETFDADAVMLKVNGDWIIADLKVEDCSALNVNGMDLDDLEELGELMGSLEDLL